MSASELAADAAIPPPIMSKTAKFLKILGEYKELIAVPVFFIGGALWVFAYFATKDQIKQLQCLMVANVSIIQGRMDSSTASQLLLENLQASSVLEAKTSLTAAETLQRSQLKATADALIRKNTQAEILTTQALNKLTSGECIGS